MAGINFQTNQITSPRWCQDGLDIESLSPGIQLDATAFPKTDAVTVTVATGGAAQGATTVPVTALTGPIPNGALIDLGTNKFARLTAAAATGATSLTTSALPTALVAGDTGTYAGAASSKATVYGGTFVSRTFAQRASNTPYHPAIATDDEFYLVAFDVYDVTTDASAAAVRPTTRIYENFLPGYTALAANAPLLAKLRATFQTMIGQP